MSRPVALGLAGAVVAVVTLVLRRRAGSLVMAPGGAAPEPHTGPA